MSSHLGAVVAGESIADEALSSAIVGNTDGTCRRRNISLTVTSFVVCEFGNAIKGLRAARAGVSGSKRHGKQVSVKVGLQMEACATEQQGKGKG